MVGCPVVTGGAIVLTASPEAAEIEREREHSSGFLGACLYEASQPDCSSLDLGKRASTPSSIHALNTKSVLGRNKA